MTATKELKEQALHLISDKGYGKGTEFTLNTVAFLMIQFANAKKSEWCKEQREICSRQVSGWPTHVKLESEIEDDIRNAPEPEIQNT